MLHRMLCYLKSGKDNDMQQGVCKNAYKRDPPAFKKRFFCIFALHFRMHTFLTHLYGTVAPAQARRPLPKKKQAEMLAAIREVVEGQQAFLEAHLTLQDVADRCGYGRTYISTLIKEEMGGFYAYVNRLRLAYVEEYLQAHPEATLGEAIDMAGFGSRPTYYHMRQKLAQE
ncbi:MAG: hypothetical protein LIR31_02040 [Bacteroidota bacterium]|nr:hypothetical protein [Bacteroidota bacterium]